MRKELETLIKEKENLLNKIQNIETSIRKILDIDSIKKIEFLDGYGYVGIDITPKSAWTDVLHLIIYKNGDLKFDTSSGGWDNPENTLFEINDITNILVKNFKTIKRYLFKLFDLYRSLNELLYKISEVEEEVKKQETLKDYKKVDFAELKKALKEKGNVKVYAYFNKLEKIEIEYNKNFGYYINNRKVRLKDIQNMELYIHKDEVLCVS
jgi:hypothetical protein